MAGIELETLGLESICQIEDQEKGTVNPRLSATRLSANFGHPPQIYWDILL